MDNFIGLLIVITVVIGGIYYYGNYSREKQRREQIDSQRHVWGNEVCDLIIAKRIAPEMTQEMVVLAWGKPTSIDQQTITKTGINKIRWVYGVPRRGARYIYFTNGKVSKIQT